MTKESSNKQAPIDKIEITETQRTALNMLCHKTADSSPGNRQVTNIDALTLPSRGRTTMSAAIDGMESPLFVHDVDALTDLFTQLEDLGLIDVKVYKDDPDGNVQYSLNQLGAAVLDCELIDELSTLDEEISSFLKKTYGWE